MDREGRETVMTYGDGIWLIGFVLLPNGETNHDEGEALNERRGAVKTARGQVASRVYVQDIHNGIFLRG